MRLAHLIVLSGAAACSGSGTARSTSPTDAAATAEAGTKEIHDASAGAHGGASSGRDAAPHPGRADAATRPRDAEARDSARGDATGAAQRCPDLGGAYTVDVTPAEAASCGSLLYLNGSTSPCVRQTLGDCTAAFSSSSLLGGDASPATINGSVAIDAEGKITSTTLVLGRTRAQCTGAWTASSSSMGISCTSLQGSQSCAFTVRRIASSCN